MVLVIAVGEFVDEPVVGIAKFGCSALRDRVDLLLAQASLQPEPDMRRPFELRGPVTRYDKDCDFGLLRCVGRAETDIRAQLVSVVGETWAFQPDMHRGRHRAARSRLAFVPDATLFVGEFGFFQLLVARHGASPLSAGGVCSLGATIIPCAFTIGTGCECGYLAATTCVRCRRPISRARIGSFRRSNTAPPLAPAQLKTRQSRNSTRCCSRAHRR